MTQTIEHVLPGRRVPSGRLVTARSHFIDRYRADCEIIHIPERSEPDGMFRLSVGEICAKAPRRKSWPRAWRPAVTEATPEGRWIMDLRHAHPENWAHFLNNHLPRFFQACRLSGHDPDLAQLLLPAQLPDHVAAAALLLGLEIRATEADVEGPGLAVEVSPPSAARGHRVEWARASGLVDRLLVAIAADTMELPRRVFLSRRDTRRIANEAEIEDLLSARGFAKVYPETLPVAAQFRLFREAREMVAVHGAGLAPLMYCTPGQGPGRLIELLPVGHMTDVYREMASAVGTDWIGVRGRIRPEHVAPAYDLDTPFKKFSLDAFEVDPVSLERALDLSQETR